MPQPLDPSDVATISTDLVEYLVVSVPDRDSLDLVVPAILELVHGSTIRVLDAALVVAGADGTASAMEISADDKLDALDGLHGRIGGLLSRHDLELVAAALEPGTYAIVLVAEDRWAKPLSLGVRAAGGEVLAGERISRVRVEAALNSALQRGTDR